MKLRGITGKVLDNGLTLLMETRENETGKAVVLVGVKSGSIHEPEGLNGGCHFNEHLLFKTNRYRKAGEINESIEWAGGYLNARTGWLSTYFFIKALPKNLNDIIQILFEASTNYQYDAEEFEQERKVILTEIKNRINDPSMHALANLFIPTLFRGTPLEKRIAGTTKSMGSVTREELQNFKRKCYAPGNMVIVVSGIFNEKRLVEKIKDTFGKIEPQSVDSPELKINSNNAYSETFEERKNIDQAYMTLGYKLPGFRKINPKELFAVEMMIKILRGGMSSRLFKEFREKRGIGYDIYSYFMDCRESSLIGITVDGFDPAKLREAEEVIWGEFKKLKRELVPDKEFRGIKNYTISMRREMASDIVYRANALWNGEICQTPYDFREWEKYFTAVTKKDVMEAARKILTPEYTLTALVPEGFSIQKPKRPDLT